jgi:hypothetical protein
MAQSIELPAELARFELPVGVQTRLRALLDQQDDGTPLTPAERHEAAGLAELRSLLHLRARRRVLLTCCPTPPSWPSSSARASYNSGGDHA